MRADIDAAFQALDTKGKFLLGLGAGPIPTSLASAGAARHWKLSLERLTDLVGEELVLAIAPANPTAAESFATGKIVGGQRLLVLTPDTLWQVTVSGRLSGSRPQGIQTPLIEIVDVRTRTERHAMQGGRKTRYLTIDRQRGVGVEIETQEHDVMSDGSFDIFVDALARQLEQVRIHVAELQVEHENEMARKIGAASDDSHPISLADEIAKLASLRDQGAITDDEYAAMKAKLLA